jgi:hypothetical protein
MVSKTVCPVPRNRQQELQSISDQIQATVSSIASVLLVCECIVCPTHAFLTKYFPLPPLCFRCLSDLPFLTSPLPPPEYPHQLSI